MMSSMFGIENDILRHYNCSAPSGLGMFGVLNTQGLRPGLKCVRPFRAVRNEEGETK